MILKKILTAVLASAIVISAVGCGKKEEEKPPENSAINVTVHTVGTDNLENTVSYTGELKAASDSSTISKVSASIQKVYVDEGDYVKAGDILAELDDTNLKSAYNSAESAYNSALSNYNAVLNSSTKQASTSAKNNLQTAQITYNQALENYNREKTLYDSGTNVKLAEQKYDDAVAAYEREKSLYDNDTSLVSARNALQTAKDNLKNTEELYRVGAASKQDYDNCVTAVSNQEASLSALESQKQAGYDAASSAVVTAEENLKNVRLTANTALENAKNTLENASNALSTAKENIGLTNVSNESNMATAKASLESSKTALTTAENNLADTKIVALSSGYIATKNATVGQMAAAGSELFSIKSTNELMAEIEVTESVIPFIEQGTKAIINISSAGINNIEGRVSLVNPTKNEKTGMYTVQVNVDNPNGTLNIGMFATVVLSLQQSNNAVTIPNNALMMEGENYYLYIASEDGKTAVKKPVAIGIENDENTEIVSGVEPGDRVIVTGQDYLSDDNTEINIVEK